MEIKDRIVLAVLHASHRECILALFVVCFWRLTERLDPEIVTRDFRLHKRTAERSQQTQHIS